VVGLVRGGGAEGDRRAERLSPLREGSMGRRPYFYVRFARAFSARGAEDRAQGNIPMPY
jgi:hypothetical protein